MHAVTLAMTAWAAEATPSPTVTVDPAKVTPGFAGFAAVAVIAVAVVLLLLDMLRRIRRGRYRSEVAEELDAEQARAAETEGDAASDPDRLDEPDDSDGPLPPTRK